MQKSTKAYQLVRALFVSLLSLFLMMAAIGFSYSVHYCHGSQTDVQLYPGLINSQPGCGCEGNVKVINTPGETKSSEVISKASCCKNLHYFQKIHLLSFEIQNKELITPIIYLSSPFKTDILALLKDSGYERPLLMPEQDHVLPAGKSWILIHHQMRIPSPSSDC
jgi:hypothetical protein